MKILGGYKIPKISGRHSNLKITERHRSPEKPRKHIGTISGKHRDMKIFPRSIIPDM